MPILVDVTCIPVFDVGFILCCKKSVESSNSPAVCVCSPWYKLKTVVKYKISEYRGCARVEYSDAQLKNRFVV